MRSIIKIFLAALLLSGTTYSFAITETGLKSYQQKTEDRHLSGFNTVDLAGSFDVYITQGSTESVKVEAPDEVIDHIITEVNNGVLKIYNKNDHFHWGDLFGSHKKIAIYVVAKDLNSINVSGSGDVFFRDGIHTNSLKLRVTGSGDMIGKVDVKIIESSISGSGDMKISGRADNSTVSVGGSGDFSGRSLATVNTSVHVVGSGDADVNASGSINASVSGSGDIRYTGGAKNIMSSKSGSGDIERY
jgi:Putative auto-transporter adhesin, head GIN domain